MSQQDCLDRSPKSPLNTAVHAATAWQGSEPLGLRRFAHSDMSQQDCLDNAEATLKAAAALIPGGWRNIRAVHLKSAESLALPVMQVCFHLHP